MYPSQRDDICKSAFVVYVVATKSFQDYDNETLITKVTMDGLSNEVTQTLTSNTKATVHYHDDNSPPSARDLLSIATLVAGPDLPRFQAHIIFCSKDFTCYALFIVDRAKAAALADSLKGQVDSNNRFVKEGKVDKMLKTNKTSFDGLDETETAITKLALVCQKYGGGIKVLKYK